MKGKGGGKQGDEGIQEGVPESSAMMGVEMERGGPILAVFRKKNGPDMVNLGLQEKKGETERR